MKIVQLNEFTRWFVLIFTHLDGKNKMKWNEMNEKRCSLKIDCIWGGKQCHWNVLHHLKMSKRKPNEWMNIMKNYRKLFVDFVAQSLIKNGICMVKAKIKSWSAL